MNKKDFLKLISYYKPHMAHFIADMFFAIVGAGIALIVPLVVRYITSDVLALEKSEMIYPLLLPICAMIALLALEMFCIYFVKFYGSMIGAHIEHDVRSELFTHYQKMSLRFYENNKVGQLLSRATHDLFDISEMLHFVPAEFTISIIKLVGSIIVMLTINWRLALIAMIPLPIIIVYALSSSAKIKKSFHHNREHIASLNVAIENSLSGIRVVKSFGNEEAEIKKFSNENHLYVESKRKTYRYVAVFHSVFNGMATFIPIIIVIGGTLLSIYHSEVTFSALIVFLLYVHNLTDPIKMFISITEKLLHGISGYERFLEMLSINPEIIDSEGAEELGEIRGEISFENVTFSYDDGSGKILRNLNFKVAAGEELVLVGRLGAGKSTICSLIPRFYDVIDGTISIDGKDIRSVTHKSLRKHIGIVRQDVFMFTGTIMENIRYGKPSATDDEVIKAAIEAHAHGFISSLPMGYKTDMGNLGMKLSEGQLQYISIARVCLKDPQILIFDEASSAMDSESEKLLRSSLKEISRNRTTIIIDHRLFVARDAQRILMLEDGKIVEEGSHRDLMQQDGKYAKFYNAAHQQ